MNKKDIEAIYPLSPSQQGMLLETLAAPESGIHIEQFMVTWKGALNPVAFKQAWQQVLQRHSILRTGFVWKNQEQPLHVVFKQVEIPLVQHDWRELSACQQQTQLDATLEDDRRSGFKLTQAPLMRLALFQTDEDQHLIVWTQHHVLMDGWCVPLILKEVLAFYKAFSTYEALTLPPVRSYRDYIAWLKQQDLFQAETFWRNLLQGFTRSTALGIKAEVSRPSGQADRYGEQKVCLSSLATTALQDLVKQHHLTLNTLIQGVWGLLLSRYSGEEDVVFGTTVSGRPPDLTGVESIVGLFINTLPIRMRVSPDISLWIWLNKVQLQQMEQRVYEYCSAGQVHQWSEMSASLPLYESILVFENFPDDVSVPHSSDATVDDVTLDLCNAVAKGARTHYAMTLLVSPDPQLTVQVIYDCDRIDSASVGNVLEHVLALLNSIVETPDQSLATLLEKIPFGQIPQVKPAQKYNQQELAATYVAPRDALELELTQIWEDVLDVPQVGVKHNFFDLGGHSLVAIRLMNKIQQQLERSLPLAALLQGGTIEQLASVIREQPDASPWTPLVSIQPNGSKRPFFCVPGAGGNVLYLYHLARHLGLDQPFYGLQARGLDGEQSAHNRVEDIAADNIQALQAIQPQGPYVLGGHSFGSYVAFEMAQQLQQQGQEVALLAILDTPTTIPGNQLAHNDDAKYLMDLAMTIESFFGVKLSISYDQLQPLSPEVQMDDLLQRLKQTGIFPPEAKLAQLRGLLQVFKTSAQTSYTPQEGYPRRIAVFRAQEGQCNQPDMGWDQVCLQPVETYCVPGDHITMVAEPHVQVLAEQLRTCLDQV